MTDFEIEPITPELGVYVKVPAERLLDDGVPEKCRELLDQYCVLVFPQIGISDAAQAELSNRMGRMKASRFSEGGESESDKLGIYPVTLDPERAKHLDYIHANVNWHMDGTTYEVPPKATCLKCETPPSEGGDTEFANLFAAYEALPAEKKEQLAGLRVVHSAEASVSRTFPNPTAEDVARWRANGPPHEQPLVWTQKDGRTSLLIGASADHIVGMDRDEGRALLEELLEWCTRPQFCYRHQWRQGDVVIWNNPGLLHRAHPYEAESGRMMHRTTIMGEEAVA